MATDETALVGLVQLLESRGMVAYTAAARGGAPRYARLTLRQALWNRNRRKRNFWTSGTGTVGTVTFGLVEPEPAGSVTCSKVGTGTVINYDSGTGTRYKMIYLISFTKKFFHSHFTINLWKFINFFLVKQFTK